jgi:hypothetical protein
VQGQHRRDVPDPDVRDVHAPGVNVMITILGDCRQF